jgi:hypothetical protein
VLLAILIETLSVRDKVARDGGKQLGLSGHTAKMKLQFEVEI